MKAQNKEEKLAKQQEREKLQREIAAREKAEKLQGKCFKRGKGKAFNYCDFQAEYEERFRSMQQEMERRQTELSTAQGTIRSLHNLSTSARVPSIIFRDLHRL